MSPVERSGVWSRDGRAVALDGNSHSRLAESPMTRPAARSRPRTHLVDRTARVWEDEPIAGVMVTRLISGGSTWWTR